LKGIVIASPGFLYLLALLPVMVVLYILRYRRSNASLNVSSVEPFNGFQAGRFRIYLRHALFALRVIAVGLLIVVLARPQSTNSYQDVTTEGIDIILTLDISGSMLARDFKPDRLEASKNVATEFISARPYDRIGLVVFSGESFTQCPLTTDHAVLINLLREIKSGIIEDGTAIGEGLATAVNRIRDAKGRSRVVILLTDGINNRGIIAPVTAAEIAKTFGVRVYTIGVGTMGVAPMPVRTPFGIRYQDMPVEIDEEVLKNIASVTGGSYFRATDNNKLAQIYSEIDKMEKSRLEVRQFRVREEKFLIPALIATMIFLLELLLRNLALKSLT